MQLVELDISRNGTLSRCPAVNMSCLKTAAMELRIKPVDKYLLKTTPLIWINRSAQKHILHLAECFINKNES